MAEIASAFVSLIPSADGFGRKLESEVGSQTKGVGKRLGSGFGKAFALGGGLIAAAGIGSLLKDSVGEAREAQKVGALTESIIKSTGGAAKVSAKQVGDLASAISLKTGVDDEAIQSGANLLLTFKNVKNVVDGEFVGAFNRATYAATDLSAAGFGSIEGASKMLGKALNDPVKGISALGRAGVTFSDDQQKLIKGFVETGDVAKAQNIILSEVESQVGGAAAASATAGEKASVAFGNLKEDLGTALLPVIDTVANAFVKFAPTISSAIGGIGPAFSKAQAFLAPFVAQIQGFFGGGSGGGILSSLQSFGALIAANLLPILQSLATTFTTVILPAVLKVGSYVISSLVPIFKQAAGIITGQVIPIISSLAQFFVGTLLPSIINIYKSVASNLKPVFDQFVATLKSQVLPTISKLLAKFEEYRPTIQKVITQVVKVIGTLAEFAAKILGTVLPVVIRFAGYLISKVVPAVADVIGVVIKIISKVLDFGGAVVDAIADFGQFLSGLKEKFGNALDYVKEIPGKIKAKLGDAGTMLLQAGKDIISGLINGIKSMAGSLVSTIKSYVIDKIPGPVKKALGIASPSKVFREIGVNTTQGLIDGLVSMKGKLEKVTRDSLTKALDSARDRLSALKSDFRSLKDSVAGAFTGDLFGAAATVDELGNVTATAGQNFIASLTAKKGELQTLLSAFKTLKGWGIPSSFLSQLFASGNGALITELAGMGQASATSTASLFGDVIDLGNQLGGAVAKNDFGPNIDRLGTKIDGLREDIKDLPKKNGKETADALGRVRIVLEGGDPGQRAYIRTGGR